MVVYCTHYKYVTKKMRGWRRAGRSTTLSLECGVGPILVRNPSLFYPGNKPRLDPSSLDRRLRYRLLRARRPTQSFWALASVGHAVPPIQCRGT
jgi:hypothetical protein